MKKLELIGSGILLIAMALAWIFFSWKLVLVLFLVLTGNNIEQRCRK